MDEKSLRKRLTCEQDVCYLDLIIYFVCSNLTKIGEINFLKS